MIFFKNDYGQGCIDEIIDLMKEVNDESNPGYGEDDYTKKAIELIKSKMVDANPDIHFIVGGTQANLTVLKHILRPYEAVVCADTGHINSHETGAVEATGHKILAVPNSSGKVTPQYVRARYEESLMQVAHMVLPKAVYISNATEMGTVYSREELEALHNVCKELNMYLFMDGARLGAALMSGVDYTLNDIARWCDVFTIGGTKNGALFGEAIVINHPDLKPYFRFDLKQAGGMLAKGWLLGLQFIGLFEHDAYYKCAKHANDCAQKIQDAAVELGYPLYMKSDTNQIFLSVNDQQLEYLRARVDFEIWEYWNDSIIIRLVSSWHTTKEEVDYMIVYLKEASSLPEEDPEEVEKEFEAKENE
jgi:threonine aldolase